ncbi:MAG: Mrp/NBP35 family ATP-binding protein [Dehalococcoidia bacterium]
MVDREKAEILLGQVMVPAVNRSVSDLNLFRRIETKNNRLKVTLSNAALGPELRESLTKEIQDKLNGLDGIDAIAVDFEDAKPKDLNQIGKVVAVMSGKGGVGKSLVSGLVALSISREGKSVGILDADVTGPSIPRMFGIHDRPFGSESGLLPVSSSTGIEIISMNLLLPQEDEAVIWRGPLLAKVINQFWEDVLWGKLDYLVVDLPPGTGDVPLTVMQSLPLSGVIIVSTPQDLASMVVRKAVKMARQMNVPILGVVENMSYYQIPDTGKRVELFGSSKAAQMAEVCDAPVLARIPIDPELARYCDEGRIEEYDSEILQELRKTLPDILQNTLPRNREAG